MSRSRTVPVLMYHHVTPEGGMINVSPENFEAQLQWLRSHGYHALSTTEFARHLAGSPAPEKSVLITFDDGYLDNWVYGYPLLKKYGFRATVFLVTAWVNDGPARRYAWANVSPTDGLPRTPPHAECERLIEQGQSDDVILRWSEIRAAKESGVFEFHSHTHTHTRWDLGDYRDRKNQKIAWELHQSQITLKAQLGEVSDHLCWPQGYFDADYIAVAKQLGFRHLYTTQAFGQNRPGTACDHIYRFAVRDTSGHSVGRRIQVAAHPVIGPMFNAWKRWKRSLRKAI